MKHILLLALTTTSLFASAQDAPSSPKPIDYTGIRFGAYLAPNMSWMHPTAATDDKNEFSTENNGSRVGFTYGLMAEYYFAENYGLITGVQVNGTGGKVLATRLNAPSAAPSTVNKADFNYNLKFLEIPLALKLRTDEISGFRFFGQLGLTAGFNIGKKVTYDVDYIDENGFARDTTGSNIKLTGTVGAIAPIMLQMNVGIGAEYPLTNKLAAYFGLFFNNGFLPDATKPDHFDNDKLGYKGDFRDANTRLNNFSVRLGLFF